MTTQFNDILERLFALLQIKVFLEINTGKANRNELLANNPWKVLMLEDLKLTRLPLI